MAKGITERVEPFTVQTVNGVEIVVAGRTYDPAGVESEILWGRGATRTIEAVGERGGQFYLLAAKSDLWCASPSTASLYAKGSGGVSPEEDARRRGPVPAEGICVLGVLADGALELVRALKPYVCIKCTGLINGSQLCWKVPTVDRLVHLACERPEVSRTLVAAAAAFAPNRKCGHCEQAIESERLWVVVSSVSERPLQLGAKCGSSARFISRPEKTEVVYYHPDCPRERRQLLSSSLDDSSRYDAMNRRLPGCFGMGKRR